MIELTRQYGRYGYRRIAALLREAGWHVNDKRVERLWRREGLKVPMKQPKRGRLWLNDGSCVRLRPEYPNHVWSYDFVHCRTNEGKAFRTLNILDEYSRECLAIRVKRRLNSTDVIDVLTDLFILRDVPANIRSDNVLCRERIWLLRSAGHGASGVPNALIWLPRRALPSRNDLFHSKHRVRAVGGPHRPQYEIPNPKQKARTLSTRSASCLHGSGQREVLPPGLTPSKKGR
jgi:hypothetical protein